MIRPLHVAHLPWLTSTEHRRLFFPQLVAFIVARPS